MSFKVETFVSSLSLEAILGLRKAELIQVADHYHVPIKASFRKADIQKALVEMLVSDEILVISVNTP